MSRTAIEIEKDLTNSGFFENKFCIHIHEAKLKDWKNPTATQIKDIAGFIKVNSLDARVAVYVSQGIGMGLNMEEAYEWYLDSDKPPHPKFIQNKMKGGARKKPAMKGNFSEDPKPQYKYEKKK